jgi:hypothetical protein
MNLRNVFSIIIIALLCCATAAGYSENITLDYSFNGAATKTLELTNSDAFYINSWNTDYVKVNGVDNTNSYASYDACGNYTIEYSASVSWAHIEVKSIGCTCSGGGGGDPTPYPTTAPTDASTAEPTAEPAATPVAASSVTIETESAYWQGNFSPFEVQSDGSASGGKFIIWPQNGDQANSTASDSTTGQAAYTFNLSQSADVTFVILVDFPEPAGSNDSFFYKLDSGSWYTQNNVEMSGWGDLTVTTFNGLSSGSHTLTLERREDGAKLDRITLEASAGTITAVSDPTAAPTSPPTSVPTSATTDAPTSPPTDTPTSVPTSAPTDAPTSPPTDTPTGKGFPIPGSFEAENYNDGGEGVGFHDTNGSPVLESNPGGQHVGYIESGEWLAYTVSVTAGNYYIDVYVASADGGGAFHIEFDGVDITGIHSFSANGSWTEFIVVTCGPVTLSGGEQLMKLGMNASAFNVDKVELIATNETPSPSPTPTAAPTPSPVPPAVPVLHTDGIWIRDASDNAVVLRGVATGDLDIRYYRLCGAKAGECVCYPALYPSGGQR